MQFAGVLDVARLMRIGYWMRVIKVLTAALPPAEVPY